VDRAELVRKTVDAFIRDDISDLRVSRSDRQALLRLFETAFDNLETQLQEELLSEEERSLQLEVRLDLARQDLAPALRIWVSRNIQWNPDENEFAWGDGIVAPAMATLCPIWPFC
jgi:hypothetical protein